MIKFESLSIPVTWGPDEVDKLNEYGENGWQFVCYTNSMPCYAVFQKKTKIKNK